ncbi:MAG: hypothetical protein ACI9Z3_001013 [Roseivirga sp.]|jgi:hypothetical protein
MNIVSIFEHSKDCLYAVLYEGEALNALRNLQKQWSDYEELRKFFIQYKRDYEAYYGKGKTNEIVEKTVDDADNLFEWLFELAEDETGNNLNQFFKPLHNKEKDTVYDLQQLKAYGNQHNSFLRVYAIRYGNSFVITGGAIKLTDGMIERPHTKAELYKLDLVKKYLEEGEDAEFVYLDI